MRNTQVMLRPCALHGAPSSQIWSDWIISCFWWCVFMLAPALWALGFTRPLQRWVLPCHNNPYIWKSQEGQSVSISKCLPTSNACTYGAKAIRKRHHLKLNRKGYYVGVSAFGKGENCSQKVALKLLPEEVWSTQLQLKEKLASVALIKSVKMCEKIVCACASMAVYN